MRSQIIMAGVIGLCTVAFGTSAARAGDFWGSPDCNCGTYAPSGQVFYAPPSYFMARPTVTIVPRIIVQPNYFVERTYVVNESRYVREAAPCWTGCAPHLVVNQGQFGVESELLSSPEFYPAPVYRHRYGRRYGVRLWPKQTYYRNRTAGYVINSVPRRSYRYKSHSSWRDAYPAHRR